ncbi:hypothetical protein E3N88_13701 [Mikania micrantha]|uniref:Uncharacterized protein n=1 Tax=Mikania micrantha TaxID=192012 RepID=A0A5N6P110_9ASTR|nr:hypothetical protein E3N88_13701 [Mikania micrantha]
MDSETNEEKRSQLARKMESWKLGLTKIADLKGKDVKDRKETEFIKEVVADIHRILRVPLNNTLPRLIGRVSEIEFISSWLRRHSAAAADILTVVGMGGIGKTSLAKYVFELHSNNFDKSSFIEGIDAKCKENLNGLLDLQKQLLGDISKNLPLHIHDVSVYTSKIKKAIAHKKVLLVLDDVGCLEQLDALLGNEAFHQGSKIIITTKDASLTERCALFDLPVQPNHEKLSLTGFNKSASFELLCIHAFKSNKLKEGYIEVSEMLVNYCQGHPLALKVLGRSLHKRDVAYWEGCIKVLKKEPDSQVNNAIKMSFDALLFENDKELFKHIACFFVGIDRDVTETILNSCDLNASYGITNLIERCLLSISWNNKLEMHSLIQEMGRDLVRQESPDKPWERSRLWCHEESFKVLKQKKDKGNLLGLSLDMRMLDKKKTNELEANSLSRMDNLMLLRLNYVQLNECFQNFPEELRWLCMHGFPLKFIHLDIPMENLVVLDMSCSNIESFGMSYHNPQPPAKRQKGLIGSCSKENRLLGSLKILDLSFSKQLHSVGGFFLLPVLERLILRNCTGLIEVCESVEQCNELVHIDLSYCYKLRKLPKSLGKLKKAQTLVLDGCNFGETHNEMGNAKAIPSDLKFLMIPLPSSLTILSIKNNNLSNECFPMDFSRLVMLKELYLDDNPIVSMPSCVRTLPRLETLHMNNCLKLISIENPPRTLRIFSVHIEDRDVDGDSLRKIKFDSEMTPLMLLGNSPLLLSFEIEIDGMVKIQGMTSVEEKVLNSLGWTNLDFNKERHLKFIDNWDTHFIDYQTQDIDNDSKDGLCYLSHWMFGPNEMEAGDHITISVEHGEGFSESQLPLECGIGPVYDEDGKNEEEKENVLGYYKSWNHIIGGDLSSFQLTTGEYVLDGTLFYESHYLNLEYYGFVKPGTKFKGRCCFY